MFRELNQLHRLVRLMVSPSKLERPADSLYLSISTTFISSRPVRILTAATAESLVGH
jgi:hypothetical protein